MIKTSARLFLSKNDWLVAKNREWEKGRLQDYQDICELVILSCTGRQLIMSRGRDAFYPAKEKAALIQWK